MPKLIYANTHDSDMLYAVRVPVPDPFFYLDTGEKQYAFVDHREFGIFEEQNENPNLMPVLLNPLIDAVKAQRGDASGTNRLALFILKECGVEREAITVPTGFPIDMADFLRAEGVTMQPTMHIFPERLTKSKEEIDALRQALVRTQKAFAFIEEVLHDCIIQGDELRYKGTPITSERLATLVEHVLVDENCFNEDGMIISCGKHAAIPHHRGAGLLRPHATIICDIFPRDRNSNFFADMTRTYVKGEPSATVQKMYAAVLDAQTRGIKAAKPGALLQDSHRACVQAFNESSFDPKEGFLHGTGHGLGFDIHEQPYVVEGNEEQYTVGHVVTIEPGLYYPEHGGVRIEDVIAITEEGNVNLTDYPKDYIIP